MEYFIWIEDEADNALAWAMKSPREMGQKEYQLSEGVSVQAWFPQDMTFQLSDERGIRLADAIPNIMRLMIVSQRLKDLLEQSSGARFEFFPVKIRNRKGRLEKAPYFVANLLESVSCLDAAQSDFVPDALAKGQVMYFKKIALDTSKIPEDAKIFRLGEKLNMFIVRKDLAQAMVNGDFTGVQFQFLEDFGKEFRS